MIIGSALVFLGMVLQASGKVLYGTVLTSVPTPLFVAVGITLTAAVFLTLIRLRLPSQGRFTLLLLNLWTAISFISFFFALKHVPPAIFASIEIGTGLLTAVALAGIQNRAWPSTTRVLACLGIVLGCALLSFAEIAATPLQPTGTLVWTAIGASVVAGATSVLGLGASRRLAMSGWTSRSTLAHRFYLTIAVGFVWLALDPPAGAAPDSNSLAWILAVAALVILVPLLLFQLAVRRIDEVTFMVCVAAQPILSFIVSIPSPAYNWNGLTLIGVLAVTLFVGLDILTQHKPAPVVPVKGRGASLLSHGKRLRRLQSGRLRLDRSARSFAKRSSRSFSSRSNPYAVGA
jgi:drug/metabolite transporter (DMT)-like permease